MAKAAETRKAAHMAQQEQQQMEEAMSPAALRQMQHIET